MTISIHPLTCKARRITPDGNVTTLYLPAHRPLRESIADLVDGYLTSLEVTDPTGQITTFWFSQDGGRCGKLNVPATRLWAQVTGFPAVTCPEHMCGTVIVVSLDPQAPESASFACVAEGENAAA